MHPSFIHPIFPLFNKYGLFAPFTIFVIVPVLTDGFNLFVDDSIFQKYVNYLSNYPNA